MKDSTYLLVIAIMAVVSQYIKPSDGVLICVFIAICSMYICRAIEKNGGEK